MSASSETEAFVSAAPQGTFARFAEDFAESKSAMLGLVVLTIIVFIALFAPWISPTNPNDLLQVSILDNRLPPGTTGSRGIYHALGTDGQGRDMLSAIFYGLRTSLAVSVSSGLVAVSIGATIGLMAAYFGGRFEALAMRLVDIQLSFPTILIALLLLAFLGQGVGKIILALIIVQWAYYARTTRAVALAEKQKEYMDAAHSLQLGRLRILFRHLLPNCLSPLIVVATIQSAHAIALEATLSFLGLGLPPTEPSLGLLIANGFTFILSGRYWISFFPGIALLITIVSINLLGDQLRNVLNPRLQK
ncbi:MAG: ABC transporter permease [Alphaproteobacteria bacterium]|nr:ABC transporter permease [Alphaproteobacteria bacterium]